MIRLSLLFFVFPFLTSAQLLFDDEAKKVTVLNSPSGQTNLVLSHYNNVMSYADEDSVAVMVKNETINDEDWAVAVFGKEENMQAVPLGIDISGGIYFARVTKKRGIYKTTFHYRNTKGVISEVIIPFFKNKSKLMSGCISKDGNFMVLAFEGNHTYGVEDLYAVKKKSDGKWSSASNLGTSINTKYQEMTPFLASDNRTLFFSSNRIGGQGSMDVYYSVRNDSWTSWTKPQPLSIAINTTGSETSFSFTEDGKIAYFVRSEDSDRYGDIYRIPIGRNLPLQKKDSPPAVLVTKEVDTVKLRVFFKGKTIHVLDKSTKKPLYFKYIENEQVATANGLMEWRDDMKSVEIKSDGYLPVILEDKEVKEGENYVYMSKLEAGKTIALDHVLFKRGTSQLLSSSNAQLDLIVEAMKEMPKVKILLKGHTDSRGDAIKNVKLSEARVEMVKDYLIKAGISPYRLKGRGYGGNEPLVSNDTEENRQKNRRVEFEVLKD